MRALVHFLFFLENPPYSGGHGGHVETVVRLTDAALKMRHSVTIYLIGDGVYAAKKDQRAVAILNIETLFKDLIKRGAEILVCATCSNFRGIETGSMIEGLKNIGLRGMDGLLEKDVKVVSFAP